MAHSKQRDEIQPALGMIRDSLPIGTGTLIRITDDSEILRASGIHPGKYLLVSNQALEDIGADDSLSVEILRGNQKHGRAYGFSKSDCIGFPTFSGNVGCLSGLSVIPIEKLNDQRNVVLRKLSSSIFKNIRGLDCYLEKVADAEVERAGLTCRVLLNFPGETGPFHHRHYEAGVDEDGFFLKAYRSETKVRFMKDFHKDERPYCSPIFNSKAEVVGILCSDDASAQKRIKPIWINCKVEGNDKR